MGKNKNKDFKKAHKQNKPKKQMHPRNIYNNKLDFVSLGKQFPEFKDCLKQVEFFNTLQYVNIY